MRDSTLLVMALSTAVLGLFGLFIISQHLDLHQDIGSIAHDDIGQRVTVIGNITKTSTSQKATFFTIADGTGNISGVIFKSMPSPKGAVTATGKVSYGEDGFELIIDELMAGP